MNISSQEILSAVVHSNDSVLQGAKSAIRSIAFAAAITSFEDCVAALECVDDEIATDEVWIEAFLEGVRRALADTMSPFARKQ